MGLGSPSSLGDKGLLGGSTCGLVCPSPPGSLCLRPFGNGLTGAFGSLALLSQVQALPLREGYSWAHLCPPAAALSGQGRPGDISTQAHA